MAVGGSTPTGPRGDSFWYKLDDKIFSVEEFVCTVSTAVMIFMVFVSLILFQHTPIKSRNMNAPAYGVPSAAYKPKFKIAKMIMM